MNLKNKPKSWQKEFRIRREEVKSKGEFKEEESSNSFIIEKPQIKKKPEKINDERGKSLFVSHKYPLTDFYCEPDKMTAFQIKKKPENLQCFDTNTKRFKDENEIKPGPGDYNSEKYYQKHHKIAFYRSSAPRFKETQSAQYISDSISYSLNEEQKKNEKINFCQNPAIFGSGTKRFIDHKKV